jgi:hypothetical protein
VQGSSFLSISVDPLEKRKSGETRWRKTRRIGKTHAMGIAKNHVGFGQTHDVGLVVNSHKSS